MLSERLHARCLFSSVHFEKKQKTGGFLYPDAGSYFRSAEVKMDTAERGKENKYWQEKSLTLFSTPVKQLSQL